MNRRTILGALSAVPAALLARSAAAAAPAAKETAAIAPPTAWLCAECGCGGARPTPEEARKAMRLHFSSTEHATRFWAREEKQRAKAVIKCRRRNPASSGYAEWAGRWLV